MEAMRKETMLNKDELSEEDRRALRGSKFAPLPSSRSQQSRPQPPPPPRLAHPGGPLTTNKAAALAKFLERKLQQPDGLANINPHLIQRAVDNAKHTLTAASGTSTSGRIIRHVSSFDDSEEEVEEKGKTEKAGLKKQKKKKMKKKKKKQKVMDDAGSTTLKKPKKKMKL